MAATWLGPLFAVHQLRNATTNTLQAWLPVALVDVARQTGIDETTIPFPRSWKRVANWDSVPEDQVPVVYITSTGTQDVVRRRAEGVMDATWRLQVMAAVRGKSYEQTAERVSVYATAIRAVLLQHRPQIDGLGELLWTGETLDAMQTQHQRTWAGALVEFDAHIHQAVIAERPGVLPVPDPPEDPFEAAPDFLEVTAATFEVS